MMGWGIAGILTVSGALTNDKSNNQYKARTDARSEVISNTPWFYLPYPGIIRFLDIPGLILFFVCLFVQSFDVGRV